MMQSTIQLLLTAVLLIPGGLAQPAPAPEFEAASLRPSPPQGMSLSVSVKGGPGTEDPGMFTAQNLSLSNLIGAAYHVRPDQLIAPGWAKDELFDISAKVPKGATRDDLRLMIRKLLADRFKLVAHEERREKPGFDLVVAKNGPKFKVATPPVTDDAAAPTPHAAPDIRVDDNGFPLIAAGEDGEVTAGSKTRMCRRQMSMADLSHYLAFHLNGTVNDVTKLAAQYDICLSWVMGDQVALQTMLNDEPASADPAGGPNLRQAVQQQLGLRLEKAAGVTSTVIVVDHLEKTPAEN